MSKNLPASSAPILPGARVLVLGLPGTVTRVYRDEIRVNLDGEGRRVDCWHRSQVEVAS